MLLRPPANFVYLISSALLLAALVFYFLDVFGLINGTLHLAFWAAVAGWLTTGVIVLTK